MSSICSHLKASLVLVVFTHEEIPFPELLVGAEMVLVHVSEDMMGGGRESRSDADHFNIISKQASVLKMNTTQRNEISPRERKTLC